MSDILENIYMDQLLALLPALRKRRLESWRIQLAIAHNPYSENPEALAKSFEPPDDSYYLDAQLDRDGMERLKNVMRGGNAFIVK